MAQHENSRKRKDSCSQDLGTEMEAERQLKKLLDNQLETKLTLSSHTERHRKFAPAGPYVPLTEIVTGVHTLKDFVEVKEEESERERLRQCGLEENEIDLHLIRSGKEPSSTCPLVHPDAFWERVVAIDQKLQSHEELLNKVSVASSSKKLSRHEMDIEKSLYAGCDNKRYLQALVGVQDTNASLHPDNPINHVMEMSQNLLARVWSCKRKMTTDKSDSDGKLVPHQNDSFLLSVNNALTDTAEPPDPAVYHVVVPISRSEILANRMQLGEIKQIPRFSSYIPGIPSKVLYVKNLHRRVDIRNLIALFSQFGPSSNESSIRYRLLKGKMKGQAFVFFPDVKSATEALELVNGFCLYGRPMIIEYGKKFLDKL